MLNTPDNPTKEERDLFNKRTVNLIELINDAFRNVFNAFGGSEIDLIMHTANQIVSWAGPIVNTLNNRGYWTTVLTQSFDFGNDCLMDQCSSPT